MTLQPPRLRGVLAAVFALSVAGATARAAELRFRHHFIDSELPGGSWGQTGLVDIDGDGDLDFVTGRSGGEIRWYEFQTAAQWVPHPVTDRSPSDVGAAFVDVDRDGHVDIVAGGAWFRNPGKSTAGKWPAHVFDQDLSRVHDVVAGDIDGDGHPDIATMSDRNDVRWYRIADDPQKPWKKTRIGPSVHAGICLGDLDRDGDLDVVRSRAWFENIDSGKRWEQHAFTRIPWSVDKSYPDSSRSRVADMNGDGRPDVVMTEAEIAGARVAWFEAPEEPRKEDWKAHILPHSDPTPRGPYHSLAVADFDNDGDLDIFTGEMEHLGRSPHRWFIWENSGDGSKFTERVILDKGLGTHEAVVGDVDGDGDIDIAGKLWRPVRDNANEGRNHADFLENLLE